MNLQKLRHVIAVDRSGSVSGAARLLHVTQSAVTKNVADVEREIGYPLFDRLARGVATTLAGRNFIDRAMRIVADMDQLIDESRAKRRAREMLLRVIICPASLEGLANRALRDFIVANPACRVHLHAAEIERGIQLLRQGDVDVCLGASDRLEVVEGFVSEPLGALVAMLFARKGHPLSGYDSLSITDIADYPVIVPDLHGPYIARITDGPDGRGLPMRRLHIIENFPMLANVVTSSDAIGIVSIDYARTVAFKKRFCTLPFDLGPSMPLAIATRAAWPDSRQISLFRAALRRYPLTGTSLA